jgi:hypothetical protein
MANHQNQRGVFRVLLFGRKKKRPFCDRSQKKHPVATGMQGKLLFSDSSPFDKKALLLSDTVKNYKTPLRYR